MTLLTDADIDLAVEVAYLALPEQQRPHLGGAPLWRVIYRAAYQAGRAEAIAEAARGLDTERAMRVDARQTVQAIEAGRCVELVRALA